MKKEEMAAETKQQLKLAGPIIAVCFLQVIQMTVSRIFLGHLGELALSAASIASAFAQITCFSIMIGMGSALDTFCGQAFGAERFSMLGIHLQRAMLVLVLVALPIAVTWVFAGQILLSLGQDPEISEQAGSYVRWLIPDLFAYGLLHCHFRFLQAQNIVLPQLLTTGLTCLLHIALCWVLIFKSGMGSRGAALADSISHWFNLFLLTIYIKLSLKFEKTWSGFSKEAMSGILGFIRLAVPSTLMICLEFWTFELFLFLSGLLPNPKLEASVFSISLSTSTIVYVFHVGFGAAVSTRVSNELGANRPQVARLALWIMLGIAIAESLVVAIVIFLVRNVWGRLYSNETEVVKHVAHMLPLVALSHLADGVQSVLSGTTRACGQQKIGALINLVVYYLIGIPVSVLLAFVLHLQGKGLFVGIICALLVQDILVKMSWIQLAISKL